MSLQALQEHVVFRGTTPCPYLPGQTARLPLRLPSRHLEPAEFDARLAAGDRRTGAFLYRTQCPACRACEPLRVDVAAFRPNRTQRRTKRRGDAELTLEIGPPLVDRERVRLYNQHRRQRGLGAGDVTEEEYWEFLVATCCDTLELRYLRGGELVAVAVADRGATSLSAVYCYFDPACSRLGLGTYSILSQIELCRAWGLRWLYLGLHVADCPRLAYKANYLPHERLLDGAWRRFERT
jgi:arginyl-tRNA--protein-N-Asp/Glu arginylyltransferase